MHLIRFLGFRVLEITSLNKSYSNTKVIQNLSFTFVSHGLYGIKGSNGVGKSTLFRLIGGAEDPDSGTLRIHEKCSVRQPLEYRKSVCWMPGDDQVFPFMTPIEIFNFVSKARPFLPDTEISLVSEKLGLAPFLNTRFDQLSTGNKKKTLLVMTLLSQSNVMLLDEPTNGLDVESQNVFKELLDQQAKQKIILFIDHFATDDQYPNSKWLKLDNDLAFLQDLDSK